MGRLFGFIGLLIAVAVGFYVYTRQMQSDSAAAGANNPKAAINLTGAKNDVVSIANAERRYLASEGKVASLDELISAGYISVARQRPPYTYDVRSTPSGFRVVATRSGADTGGVPAELSVDETMEFRTSE